MPASEPSTSPAIRRRIRATWASAACIAITLVLVFLVGGLASLREGDRARFSVLRSELVLVQSHSERTVGQIESQLAEVAKGDLQKAATESWLRKRWRQSVTPPARLYGAVLDEHGKVLSHSDRNLEGKVFVPTPRDSTLSMVGPNLFDRAPSVLSGNAAAIEFVVPISYEGKTLGTYHAGIDRKWLFDRADASRTSTIWRWEIVIALIAIVTVGSSVLLFRITSRAADLERAVAQEHLRRVTEIGQLAAGLAHEIRNPLNVVRLNVFTTERVLKGEARLSSDEVSTMLGESVREIQRVDELISLLLGYARPLQLELVPVNLKNEIEATVQFIRFSLDESKVKLKVDLPESSPRVMAGRSDIRQILLNLLVNARDALPDSGGMIRVTLCENASRAELTVQDNGAGIPPAVSHRIFDPFFTTKSGGTGLGLSIVRSLLEAAGATIEMEKPEEKGCRMRVTWPTVAVASSSQKVIGG